MGKSLGWCLSMATWAHGRREGFMSSGQSEDDNNTIYSKHLLSMQLVLPSDALQHPLEIRCHIFRV